jgi:hypothetical protein
MKHLVKITVVASERATSFNQETKSQEPKTTKDGKPVFNLYYEEETEKEVGGKKLLSKEVKKISSLIEVEGEQLLEVEHFIINGKLFVRALAVAGKK